MNTQFSLSILAIAAITGLASAANGNAAGTQDPTRKIVQNAQFCYYTNGNGTCGGGDSECDGEGQLYYSEDTHVFYTWHNGLQFVADKNTGVMQIKDMSTGYATTSAFVQNGVSYSGARLDFTEGLTYASLFCYHMGVDQN